MISEIEEYRRLVHMLHCYTEITARLAGDFPLVSTSKAPDRAPKTDYGNNPSSDNRQVRQDLRATRREASELPLEERQRQLQELAKTAATCRKCQLAHHRRQVVFGAGPVSADLVIIGEAPGEHEDLQGIPFVGNAGQLLVKMLESINLTRDQVYICNVIKCHPPGNRNPEAREIISCRFWLTRQLQLVHPKVLCAMGKFASQTLTGQMLPMWKFRGNIYHYQGIPLLCTYHPARLLRVPEDKRKSWQDLLNLKELLEKISSHGEGAGS